MQSLNAEEISQPFSRRKTVGQNKGSDDYLRLGFLLFCMLVNQMFFRQIGTTQGIKKGVRGQNLVWIKV